MMQPFRFRSSSVAVSFGNFLKDETGATPSIDATEEPSGTTIPEKVWTVRLRNVQLSEEQLERLGQIQGRLNAERSAYLKKRATQYANLDSAALDAAWANAASLDSDELDALRVAVRDRKGIVAGTSGSTSRVCPQCGMVEDNCTCGRTWF